MKVRPSKRVIKSCLVLLRKIQSSNNFDENAYQDIVFCAIELKCFGLVEWETLEEAVEIMLNKYDKENLK